MDFRFQCGSIYIVVGVLERAGKIRVLVREWDVWHRNYGEKVAIIVGSENIQGNFLVVQWLGLHPLTAEDPACGTKSHKP